MKLDVICLGELLIDFVSYDKNVSIMESSGFKKAPGGAPANVAAGVSRLGLASGFIGKVGDDPFGYFLKKVLEEVKIDTTCLVFDKYARTTLSFVAQKSQGERDCMFYRNPGADMLLEPKEIPEEYIKNAKIFHFGSISLGSEKSKAATLKSIEYAKKHGLLISYDPNLRLSLWENAEKAKQEINSGFESADIVKISEEEYGFITGCKSIEECTRCILSKGPKLVIVTLGEKGCYYDDGTERGYVGGFKANVVETTGAGDAFVAAVLYFMIKRLDLSREAALMADNELIHALAFANAAGALATTKLGAIPSLPTKEEVENFLEANRS